MRLRCGTEAIPDEPPYDYGADREPSPWHLTDRTRIRPREFPRDAIREAIVNAVCHRDYTSNACVQVMLFRDRLEIINPGPLPKGLTVEDLYRTHDSIPRNSLIARAMSWTSYVEKSGSGTGEILDKCVEYGLARPEFDPTVGFFKTVIWRAARTHGDSQGLVKGTSHLGPQKRAQEAGPRSGPKKRAQETGLVGTQSAPSRGTQSQHSVGTQSRHPVCCGTEGSIHERVISFCDVPRSTKELLNKVGRSDRTKFKRFVLRVLMEDGILEWTIPDKPNSRLQKYRLTAKGRTLAAALAKSAAKSKGKGRAK